MLTPVKIVPSSSVIDKVSSRLKKAGITENDVEEAVAWARTRTGTNE